MPGAFQIFIKAAQEFNKDSTIDEKKLFKLMKDGKLLAKDILPLVGKYFAEDARAGGALDKQLQSIRVATARLNQSWLNLLNNIFKGGFGQELTEIFNLLSATLEQNSENAETMGKFFGGMLEQAKRMFIQIHDWIIIIHAMLLYYTEDIRKAFKDAFGESLNAELMGRIVALFLMVGFLKKTLGFLLGILGVIRSIKKLGGLAGALGGGVIGAEKTSNGGKTPKTPKGGSKLGFIGKFLNSPLGKLFGGALLGAQAGDMIYDRIEMPGRVDAWAQEAKKQGLLPTQGVFSGFWDMLKNSWANKELAKQQYNRMSLLSDRAGAFWGDVQGMLGKGEITVNVKVDQGVLKEIIDTQIELSQMDMIDLINGSIESTTE